MRNLLKESDTKVNGHPISFIDIDETTMHTFDKINVMKDGKVVKSLDNKEFNTHELGDGETYNFDNFKDAKYFNQTSQPIEKTINRIKNIIQSIKDNKKQEKVIFLTARSDFDDKEVFLDTFRNFGIDVDIPNVYIERSGNLTDIKNVADRKKYVILKYLKTGLYTNAKMYDDDKKNLQTFEELGQEVNAGRYNILNNVKKNFPKVNKINFYPLLVTDSGKIKMYESKDSNEEILIEAINAYHGSHKDFEEFETKYVGTGEECQAHGWGLYFSLNPDTGKGYHERISSSHSREKKNGTDTVLTYNGKRYDPKSVQGILINKMYKDGKSDTIRFLNNLSKESKFTKNPEQWKQDIKNLYNMVNKIDQSKFKESVTVKKGQFYTVKIPDLDTYLDEEKRIKNQDSYIVDKCKEIMIKLNKPFKAKDLTGRQFYEKLKFYSFKDGANVYSNSPKEVSEFLYDNGITGIKYDGRRDGECVVVFNQNDVKIVKKDVDYTSMEKGLEMSDITKFIDDPKKLKGKRVPTEIIDWFIENRPELINDNVFREKLTLAQKIKLLLYKADYNALYNDYSDEIFKNVELQKELPEIDLVELFIQSISMSRRIINYDKKYIEDIIKRIPIEIKKKYIQKFGTKCIERFLSSDDSSDEDKISILNEFFKDIKIDDIKDTSLKSNDRFVIITGKYTSTGWSDYMLYCDTLKYFIVLNEINSGSIVADKVYFDDIAIKCMEENRKSRIDIQIREELHIDKKVLPQFLNLLKYNKDGYYALFDNSYNIPEITNEIAEYYTEDVLKSFNQIDDPINVPAIIKELISIDPVKLKFVNDEILEVSLRYFHSNKLKIFDVNILKELGESKVKVIYDFYLKDINSQFVGTSQTSYNRLKFLIENDLVNDKDSILKTAKAQPELLLYYKNIDSKLQKIICSKNPYLIRFIRNPDKTLVNQIKTKIPNIEDYVENGE